MVEKAYKTMKCVGAMNIVIGIIILITGIASGILMIVGGGKLLKDKSNIMF